MRVAVLVEIFLIIFSITAFVMFFFSQRAQIWERLRPSYLLILLTMMVAIPIVVYHGLKLWLEGDLSQYPDIDDAWRTGLLALDQHGLDLQEIPLCVVLGIPNDQQADNLMQASELSFDIAGEPSGRAPLRWYVSDRTIYLVTVGLGCLGRLNQMAVAPQGEGGQPSDGAMNPANLRGTLVAGASPEPGNPASGLNEPAMQGTVVPQPMSIQGTLVPGAGSTASAGASPSAPATAAVTSPIARRELEEQTLRLEYFFRLLKRQRQPLCALNGILAVLPASTLREILLSKDMASTIRRDLAVVSDVTQVACSVTALISGMEQESGFTELVRRVGAARSKSSRFGKGFNVWNHPGTENLEALAAQSCGAFEDWVYAMFREEESLNKPGNGKLYQLLCTIRSELTARIRNVLIKGFSSDPVDGGNDQEPVLFGGCYFAATGDTPDRQAFVRSTLEKVIALEEDVEWTQDARSQDQRYHRYANISMTLNGLLLLTLIGLFLYRWYS